MLTALGRTKFLLILQLIWIGTLVPAMVLGVHKDGIVGAAYAHVAVILPIVLPSYLLALKRVTGVRLTALGRALLPAILASSAAALAARAAASPFDSPLAQLAAGLAAGGVTYVIGAAPQAVAVLAPNPVAERVLQLLRLRSPTGRPAAWQPGEALCQARGAGPGSVHRRPGPACGSSRQTRAGSRAPVGPEDLASHASLTNGITPGRLAGAGGCVSGSASSPTGSSRSAPTIPTRWHHAPISPTPTARRAG